MPRPTDKKNSKWRSAYWIDTTPVCSKEETQKIFKALCLCMGLDRKKTIDCEKGNKAFSSVMKIIETNHGLQPNLDKRPREESRRVELEKMQENLKNALDSLLNLSDVARTDLLDSGIFLCAGEALSTEIVNRGALKNKLDRLPTTLEDILFAINRSLQYLDETAMGRGKKPRGAMRITIDQLEQVFKTFAHKRYRDDKQELVNFLKKALQLGKIDPPKNLFSFLPRN